MISRAKSGKGHTPDRSFGLTVGGLVALWIGLTAMDQFDPCFTGDCSSINGGVGFFPLGLAAVIIGLATCMYLNIRPNTLERIGLELSPEVLAQKSREIITRLGYPERPADTAPGPARRVVPGDVRPVESYPTGVRRSGAGDDVEQRRLAGAIGPDQAEHLAGGDGEAHVVERADPAEADHHTLELEDRSAPVHRLTAGGAHLIPSRRTSCRCRCRGSW